MPVRPARISPGAVSFHGLGEVGRGHGLVLQHQILVEEAVPAEVETVEQHLLGGPAPGGVGGSVFGEIALVLVERGILGDQVIDHPDALCLGAVDHVAANYQRLGAAEPDVARQAEGPEPGDQPFLDRGQPELGRRRADADVAGQRKLQTAADGIAVNQAEDQFVHRLEHPERRVPHIEITRLDPPRGEMLEIDPG